MFAIKMQVNTHVQISLSALCMPLVAEKFRGFLHKVTTILF